MAGHARPVASAQGDVLQQMRQSKKINHGLRWFSACADQHGL